MDAERLNETELYSRIEALEAKLATARREGFVAGAEAMRESAACLCRAEQVNSKEWQDRTQGVKRAIHCASTLAFGEMAKKIRAIPIEGEDSRAELLDECREVIQSLLAVVRIQNGNLHDDTNRLQGEARALLARLPAEKG